LFVKNFIETREPENDNVITKQTKTPPSFEAVLRFLDENKSILFLPENAGVSTCFLAGDSAGGNLAHHVAVRACKAGLQKIRVIGLISIQPFFGGEERTEAEIRLEGSLMISMREDGLDVEGIFARGIESGSWSG
jgi:hypothetical protein